MKKPQKLKLSKLCNKRSSLKSHGGRTFWSQMHIIPIRPRKQRPVQSALVLSCAGSKATKPKSGCMGQNKL